MIHDFLTLWAAGVRAWDGQAALAYHLETHRQFQEKLIGSPVTFLPLPYPPHFLFFLLPFAPLSYLPATATFLVTTIAGYASALRLIVGDWLTATAMALSFGGGFIALYYVQAPYLIGALLVGGLALMPTRPIFAGVLFGMLTVKPHLGVALAVALLLGRQWKTIGAAIATAAAMIIAATVAFGPEVWSAYWRASQAQYASLISGLAWVKASSVYATFYPIIGAQRALALQAMCALLALILMGRLWVHQATYAQRAAAVIAATLLISPYLYVYDAVLLTGAAAFLLSPPRTETPKMALVALSCVLPGFSFAIYGAAVPIAAWVMLYLAASDDCRSIHQAGQAACSTKNFVA
jgi:hypothetical protein